VLQVRVAIKSITQVSTVDGTASIRFGVVFYWTDPRLVGWDKERDVPRTDPNQRCGRCAHCCARPVSRAQLPHHLWCPKLLCVDKTKDFASTPDGIHLLDSETGRLKRGYNFDGDINNPLEDMANFPYDLEVLDVRFYTESNWEIPDGTMFGMEPKKKIYSLSPVVPGIGEGAFWWFGWKGVIDEWTLHGKSYKIEEHPPTASGALGTSLKLRFHMSRDPGFYQHKVILPLGLLGVRR
jgi:hypothetical protein